MRVFTNGCFDILHRGHVELLAFCRSFGEVTVGLNSDNSVRRLKGADRPFNKAQDRKLVLESIKYVDRVIIFEEDTPYELLSVLMPDLIVKGGDYLESEVIGRDLCPVKIFSTVEGFSTTKSFKHLTIPKK